MPNEQPPVRDYKFSDSRLVEIAIEKIAYARRDETELATEGISAAWVDAFETEVLAFQNRPTDATELAEQVEATEDRTTSAVELRDKLKDLWSAVKRAFGENSAKARAFNLLFIDEISLSELFNRSTTAQTVAAANAVALAAKGWSAADQTDLGELIEKYRANTGLQALGIGDRDSAQEDRVYAGNALYNNLENELCETGKSYWRTRSAAKYNDYLIYNTISGTDETPPPPVP